MAFPLSRCHTFGIGSEVCVELVTGIAAASGGRCVLLADGERLQTKVCADHTSRSYSKTRELSLQNNAFMKGTDDE